MKKLLPLIAVVGALLTTKPMKAQEIDSTKDVSLSLDAAYCSDYVSNGMKFSDGQVIQLTTTAGYKRLQVSNFINFDKIQKEFNESDLFVKYSQDIENVGSIGLEFMYFTFPNSELRDAKEIHASFESSKFLKPTFDITKDFDDGKGIFTRLGVEYDISKQITLEAETAHNYKYWRQSSGFSHIGARIVTSFDINKSITFSQTAGYNYALNKEPSHIKADVIHAPLYNQGFFTTNITFNY